MSLPLVPEIDVKAEGVSVFEKMKFSMLIDEVQDVLKRHPERKDVILFGIEVRSPLFVSRSRITFHSHLFFKTEFKFCVLRPMSVFSKLHW